MNMVAPPPRYDEWIDFYFFRDVTDPWQMEWEFEADADTKAVLFAETLTRCGTDLKNCTDDQLATGLKAIWLGDLSNTPHDICKSSDSSKRSAIQSFKTLYSDLLTPRSPPVLGHLNESDGSPLEYITYMAWDVSPMTCLTGLKVKSGNQSFLVETMAHVLASAPANPAVLESILHGLGHLAGEHPKHQQQIAGAIDQFLTSRPIVRQELKLYAHAANEGRVQ